MADDMDAIRHGLRERAEELARRYEPSGYREAHRWWAKSTKPGKKMGSLCIDISGPTKGRWADFASDGLKGDLIDLIAYREFGAITRETRGKAIGWAKSFLGGMASQPVPQRVKRQRAAEERAEQEKREQKALTAKGWFLRAERSILGTPVDGYLRGRGIDLRDFPKIPQSFRYQARCQHAPSGQVFPAMISAMSGDVGQSIRAIHRTWIDPYTLKKADVEPNKMMFAPSGGCAVRVTKGASGLSPEEAARKNYTGDRVVIMEGIEDALTWAMLYPDDRVLAAGSISNIGSCPVFPCASLILVVADNDPPGSTARRDLDRALDRLKQRARSVPVSLTMADRAKDVNALYTQVAT